MKAISGKKFVKLLEKKGWVLRDFSPNSWEQIFKNWSPEIFYEDCRD